MCSPSVPIARACAPACCVQLPQPIRYPVLVSPLYLGRDMFVVFARLLVQFRGRSVNGAILRQNQ